MKHYKIVEIARKYDISNPTVYRWMDETREGKKDLDLIEYKGSVYIAKTTKNEQLMQEYVAHSRKYKKANSRVNVRPNRDFVKYLSDRQLIEIKQDLVEKQQIDLKYGYIDGGAEIWDKTYYHSQGGSVSDEKPYHKMNTLSIQSIAERIGDKKINIIDIGAGNGLSLLFVLKKFSEKGILNSYTAIDISSEMNEIAKRNISKELPDLRVQSYTRDIEIESFEDIIYEMYQDDSDTINIIFIYGMTIGNFTYPERLLMNIERSMLPNDILYINTIYPNENKKTDAKYMYESPTVDYYMYAVKSLGFEVGVEDLNFHYDKNTLARQFYVTLPKHHALTLSINDKDETLEFPKGYKIRVFQIKMMDLDYIKSITGKFNFKLVLYQVSRDDKFMVTVFKKESLNKVL